MPKLEVRFVDKPAAKAALRKTNTQAEKHSLYFEQSAAKGSTGIECDAH